jgi:hypothetical protein
VDGDGRTDSVSGNVNDRVVVYDLTGFVLRRADTGHDIVNSNLDGVAPVPFARLISFFRLFVSCLRTNKLQAPVEAVYVHDRISVKITQENVPLRGITVSPAEKFAAARFKSGPILRYPYPERSASGLVVPAPLGK